ncbi:MAG: FMN-binding negative transcriptional regulator [Streptomyces sp.]|nr:FMN-binding negative transcriptional regulator [Streptomyces sp.]
MFVPPLYREPDASWMLELIRRNPLAMMVSNGTEAEGPFATHLPVIPDPRTAGEPAAGLAGTTLLGHMNRANPHWAALRAGATVLLTFTGPHAYVSPTLYEVSPAAPTWNFTAVHARGTIEKLDEGMPDENTLGVVTSTVRAFEDRFGTGWDMSESLGYFREIMPAVGAFRFTVSSADAMFKLSQEKSPDIRGRVERSFRESACGRHRATADLMEQLP